MVSLQVNTADIMAMNRVDRIVLDPNRTYACTRTARTGVRVTGGRKARGIKVVKRRKFMTRVYYGYNPNISLNSEWYLKYVKRTRLEMSKNEEI